MAGFSDSLLAANTTVLTGGLFVCLFLTATVAKRGRFRNNGQAAGCLHSTMMPSALKAEQSRHQCIHVIDSVVEGQRGSNRAFKSVSATGRLGAMMAGANRTSFLIERLPDVLRAPLVENKGKDACLLLGGPDQP